MAQEVAPFVGAWIETCDTGANSKPHDRRSLRGSVD